MVLAGRSDGGMGGAYGEVAADGLDMGGMHRVVGGVTLGRVVPGRGGVCRATWPRGDGRRSSVVIREAERHWDDWCSGGNCRGAQGGPVGWCTSEDAVPGRR
jgi:hypothetical protein